MTSKIVVNNIESDSGISSVTVVSDIAGQDSTQNISGINSVTAISFHGYGKDPLDILKPGVLKSSVKVDTKLQYTTLNDEPVMKPINEILEKLPCTYERVRFMKLVAGKVIGKHSDKIDKDIESGNIVRIHVPIRTNEDVIFTLYENARDKIGNEHNLKTGHFYYTDVSKPHAVRNNSNIDRIHLVVDCHANSALRTLIP